MNYDQIPAPPSTGDYPDRYVFNTPGQSVEGYVRDVRMTPPGGTYEPCPVLDLQTTQVGPDGRPVCWSVFCNPTSLWRQLKAQTPAPGAYVRVTFKGNEGQAKVFTLEVAPPGSVAPAPAMVPVQAPTPQPGFPPQAAYEQPFGAGAPAAPWAGAPTAPQNTTAAPPPNTTPSPWGQ